MKKLFLTGYEKETLEEFLAKLKKSNIRAVIDVREIPLSHKNGFSKEYLEKILQSKKIKYYHFPALGSFYKSRKQLRTRNNNYDYFNFFRDYRNNIKNKKEKIKEVSKIVSKNKNSTLLCFEKESELCHRSIIASEILKMDSSLKVIPL